MLRFDRDVDDDDVLCAFHEFSFDGSVLAVNGVLRAGMIPPVE